MNKFPIFKLEQGSNLVRFLTPPFRCHYHIHNGKRYNVLTSTLTYSTNECNFCMGDMNFVNSPLYNTFMFGIRSLKDNKKYILINDKSVFSQLRNFARRIEYGDPTKFHFDLCVEDTDVVSVEIMDSDDNCPQKDTELFQELSEMTNAMNVWLYHCESLEDFKNLYLKCHKSKFKLSTNFIKLVDINYPQFKETLNKLLIFS